MQERLPELKQLDVSSAVSGTVTELRRGQSNHVPNEPVSVYASGFIVRSCISSARAPFPWEPLMNHWNCRGMIGWKRAFSELPHDHFPTVGEEFRDPTEKGFGLLRRQKCSRTRIAGWAKRGIELE